MTEKTIHIILNSHLDPVWSWRRTQGIDEVIATARTGCDLLDRYPEILITRGEAWFYQTIEKCAPEVFRRVAKHIENRRWHVTGGFYIQPDCNLPQAETLLRQGEFAQNYFEKRFGFRVKTGFNLDSFGHAATIPDIWNACGMENYVMSRPENAVLPLPGNLFEWHGANGGKLNTYRLTGAYCSVGPDLREGIKRNFEESLGETAPGMQHLMGFAGVGNHGGGPVAKEIEFLLDNPDIIPGCKLKFSTPDDYFEAVKDVEKPVWNNELQHHAVGCYSAIREIKEGVRTSENLLKYAENCLDTYSSYADVKEEKIKLSSCWEKLFLATFHDVLPGTSVKSAYQDIFDDLGACRSTANEIIEPIIKQRNNSIAPCKYQQLVFDNLSDLDFRGFVECEPWLGYNWTPALGRKYEFYDENNIRVPSQEIACECAMSLRRFALKLDIPSRQSRIITIRECKEGNGEFTTPAFAGVSHRYMVYQDLTDTWSHSVDRYPSQGGSEPELDNTFVTNSGHLFQDTVKTFSSKEGRIQEICRNYADIDQTDLFIRINWLAQQQLIKLEFTPSEPVSARQDAVPGAFIQRSCNGKEYPVQGATVLTLKSGKCLAITGNFSACDVQPDGKIRLTLLRTPIYSHHDPKVIPANHIYNVSGTGVNEYRLKVSLLDSFDAQNIMQLRNENASPIFFSEVTLGCTSKYEEF